MLLLVVYSLCVVRCRCARLLFVVCCVFVCVLLVVFVFCLSLDVKCCRLLLLVVDLSGLSFWFALHVVGCRRLSLLVVCCSLYVLFVVCRVLFIYYGLLLVDCLVCRRLFCVFVCVSCLRCVWLLLITVCC